MSNLPTDRQKQLSLVLFPFKAYTVIGIIFFVIWFAFVNEHTRNAYYHGTAFIFFGHFLAGIILIIGGLIQRLVLKGSGASWSIAFGIVNFFIIFFVLPNMRSG